MQTSLKPEFLATEVGQEADAILRSCVHCGFCTATCPTYQLLGDELDSPRGRIYQIKQVLEGNADGRDALTHLDRCLVCRSCETTCPSGVRYHRLLEIGIQVIEAEHPRTGLDQIKRKLLLSVVPYPARFNPLLKIGQAIRPLLFGELKRAIPAPRKSGRLPRQTHTRRMLILEGCAQTGIAPSINASARRVLDQVGIGLVSAAKAGCCGAMHQHMNQAEQAKAMARQNIDAWWPEIESGAQAIIMTASGCGTQVKDYATILSDDPDYADKARRVSDLCQDLTEIVLALESEQIRQLCNAVKTSTLDASNKPRRVAVHTPCSLQHGQGIKGKIEALLQQAGYPLATVQNGHLCCGSAGAYSLLQTDIADQLKQQKLKDLQGDKPDLIVTANIGCLTHLDSAAAVPVHHWIELLDA